MDHDERGGFRYPQDYSPPTYWRGPLRCTICGAGFYARNTNTLYCGDACKAHGARGTERGLIRTLMARGGP